MWIPRILPRLLDTHTHTDQSRHDLSLVCSLQAANLPDRHRKKTFPCLVSSNRSAWALFDVWRERARGGPESWPWMQGTFDGFCSGSQGRRREESRARFLFFFLLTDHVHTRARARILRTEDSSWRWPSHINRALCVCVRCLLSRQKLE